MTHPPSASAPPPALGRWLQANVEGFQPPFTLAELQSSSSVRIRAASGDYVIRADVPSPRPASDHSVAREFRLLGALHPLGFPVPRPLAECEDEAVIGAAFSVSELALGRSYADAALPEFDAATRARMYAQLVDMLADLHSIDPHAAGLGDLESRGSFFQREVARWTRHYRDHESDFVAEMERLIAFLPETLPSQAGSAIIHGEYRIDNMLFDGDGTLTAVLDWRRATLGDPLADFSYFAMHWMLAADGAAGLAGLDLKTLGIPSLKAIAARYSKRSGVAVTAQLDWYFAFHLFRLAAVEQGRRKGLATAAWTFAQRAGA